MSFALLGVLEVRGTGGPLNIGRGRERALLAFLLLHPNEPVDTDTLIEALWPLGLPVRAQKSLQICVSRLRSKIGAERLATSPGAYRLHVEPGELDVDEFNRLAAAGRAQLADGDAVAAEAALSEALALWRGPALTDFRFAAFAQAPIGLLEEARAAASADRIDARLMLGRAQDVLPELEALIRERPYWERLRRAQMLALYDTGRQADALAVFRETRRLFAAELGIEPGPELQQLEREILQQDPALRSRTRTVAPLPRRKVATASLVLGIAALTGAVALAVHLGTSARGAPLPTASPNSVAVIDAPAHHLAADVAVGARSGALAYGSGAVWVANSDGNTVSRIDAATNQLRQEITVGDGPAAVTVGGGDVWVANGLDGTVSRIDAAANRLVQTVRGVGNGPAGIAYGAGNVWVGNSVDGTVTRIDSVSGDPTGTFPAVVGATGVAFGFGRVWVVSPSAGVVVALNPRSGQVVDRVSVGVDPQAITAGAGAIWVTNRADNTVSRIDPRPPAHVTATTTVGRAPVAIVATKNAVWVANSADRTVMRIDGTAAQRGRTITLANAPSGLAASAAAVYVAVGTSGLEHRGGTLRFTSSAPDSLDPAQSALSRGWAILSMTNDGLVAFRRTGGIEGIQLEPDLATSLPTPTNGGKTYTFHLRPGVRYSTGKLVQPEDIRAEIERIFEIKPPSYGQQFYRGIIGAAQCRVGHRCNLSHGIVTNAAAQTVTFHLDTPDADFLDKLALTFASAVPASASARLGGARIVPATGPYMIAAYKPGRSITLVRNPMFHEWSADARPDGYPDKIVGTLSAVRKNPFPEVRAILQGHADVAPRLVEPPLSRSQLTELTTRYPSQVHFTTGWRTEWFFLNTRVPPFDRLAVRQAVNEAFDRKAFLRLSGPGTASTCQILPPNYPGYRRACPYGPGGTAARARARRIIRSSGQAGAAVTVWVPTPRTAQGRFYASFLNDLGFHAHLKVIDAGINTIAAYFGRIFDRATRAQTGWSIWGSDFPSDADFLTTEYSCAAFAHGDPQTNQDASELCDPAIDRLLARASTVQSENTAAASALWQKAERAILADAPLLPTDNQQNVAFLSKRTGNFQYNPQWGVLLDQLWVK